MNILIIGGGGREHALAWKLSLSERVDKLYVCPGNAGMEKIAECVPAELTDDIDALIKMAGDKSIGLTVVGPEAPLTEGIVDRFTEAGLRIFGPSKGAARLEASKVFSKEILRRHNIPTGEAEIFSEAKEAISFMESKEMPVVVKADGLAGGKGVIICKSRDEAVNSIKLIMDEMIFGSAGSEILIEEYLEGQEVSILAFTDGESVLPLIPSQDHKAVYDADEGPNTGGMGAYAPATIIDEKLLDKITGEVLTPVVRGMAKEGKRYTGVLYAGLILTGTGPKVLEFNVRFGDPETQAVLPLLKTDILTPIEACIDGNLRDVRLEWERGYSVCVVLASGGYPGKYEKGKPINGLEEASKGVRLFHAGTATEKDNIVTNGGRVLGVTGAGTTLEEAIGKTYSAVSKINFEGMHYRKDIGKKGKVLIDITQEDR